MIRLLYALTGVGILLYGSVFIVNEKARPLVVELGLFIGGGSYIIAARLEH